MPDDTPHNVAQEAKHRIVTHEQVCEERYLDIRRQLGEGADRMGRMERWMIVAAGTTIVQLIGIVLLLAGMLWSQ